MLADPIADLRSSIGALISLYAERPSPGGMSARLTDLLKEVRERAADQDRMVEKSVNNDIQRIKAIADRLEADTSPGYAIFASDHDDVFVVEALTHSVPNVSDLGSRPFLRPLRTAPRPFRAGILVADRALARVFVAAGDLVEEIGEPIEADIGKTNYGGFTGYDEYTVRRHAEESSQRMWKDAGSRLLEIHQSRPFDYLAIGTHDETVEDIARQLHPYLASLYRAPFVGTPQTITIPTLRAEMADIGASVRRRRQTAVAGRVCDTAWSGGLAVLGLQETLDAANALAIETLVVAGPYAKPGAMCDQCGYLARIGNDCPVCGSRMFPVHDVVSAVMDATVSAGGKVHQVEVASPLDVEGIGALTRFTVATQNR